MRKLNTAQKIILVIGLIALAVRCFTYEPYISYPNNMSKVLSLNYTVVFHCLGIISITSILMLIAGLLGDPLSALGRKFANLFKSYLADKIIVLVFALIVIAIAIMGGIRYFKSLTSIDTTTNTKTSIDTTTKPTIQLSEVELFDMRFQRGYGRYNTLLGRVKNNSSTTISKINLNILIYDYQNKYIDTARAYINFWISPGEVKSFSESIRFNTEIPTNLKWNYKVISIEK